MFLFCHKSEIRESQDSFTLAWSTTDKTKRSPVQLKERIWFGVQPFGGFDVVLLWDIENNWFACRGNDVAFKLSKSLSALRARWLKEGRVK